MCVVPSPPRRLANETMRRTGGDDDGCRSVVGVVDRRRRRSVGRCTHGRSLALATLTLSLLVAVVLLGSGGWARMVVIVDGGSAVFVGVVDARSASHAAAFTWSACSRTHIKNVKYIDISRHYRDNDRVLLILSFTLKDRLNNVISDRSIGDSTYQQPSLS